jgi:hypothetical protein
VRILELKYNQPTVNGLIKNEGDYKRSSTKLAKYLASS